TKDFGTPLVSVILCTYNREKLVTKAVKSALNQSYRNIELIIIDDGSADGTMAQLTPIALADPRIIFVRHANKGLARSRNVGLRLARGKYVCFLDSDDWYLRDHIRKRVELMERRNSIAMLYGRVHVRGPRSKQSVVDLEHPGKMIHVSRCYVGGTFFARRSVLMRVGGFREIPFGEDLDLVLRVKKRFAVRRVDFPTYVYNCTPSDRLCLQNPSRG
ncbi:MAG: glycosyltransferase family 2 protein, partial [Ignavibacteriales bacterium]|nr:glycosyltransferase family 2 protein [Ignavibacteriales bacterium]